MRRSLVFATKLSSCSVIALTVFGLGCQSKAASITLGNTSGQWFNPIRDEQNLGCADLSSSKCFVKGIGTNSFSWGEPEINTPPEQQNRVTFDGNNFPASVDIDQWFSIGTLKYFNGIIYADTNIQSATLNLNLSFGDTDLVSKSLPVTFNFLNTPNNNTENIKAPENSDYVELIAPLLTSFTLNNNSYLLEIAGLKISALEGEDSQDNRDIYARVSTPPKTDSFPAPSKNVPEGSTLAGSLLTAIYLVSLKNFSKQKAKSSGR